MVTAAVERILQGDDTAGPEPDATFLWVTDQPELNEQTRRKMLAASSGVAPAAGITTVSISRSICLAQDFGNLIHPGRAERTQQKSTRGTATLAVGAAQQLIEHLELVHRGP